MKSQNKQTINNKQITKQTKYYAKPQYFNANVFWPRCLHNKYK